MQIAAGGQCVMPQGRYTFVCNWCRQETHHRCLCGPPGGQDIYVECAERLGVRRSNAYSVLIVRRYQDSPADDHGGDRYTTHHILRLNVASSLITTPHNQQLSLKHAQYIHRFMRWRTMASQCPKIIFILGCQRGKLEQKMWMRAEN